MTISIENKLLTALEYLREYQIYFHLGQSYGLSESDCYRFCRSVEDILIRSCEFLLPGKKAFLKSDVEYELILLDASEKQIEGTKKVGKKKRLKKSQ
jgi:hypothetical protein